MPPAGQAVGTPFALSFSSSGALSTIDGVAATTAGTAAYDPANGAASMTLTIDLTGTTQYGSSFAVNNLSQDGYTSGRLAGVDIDAEGVVFARYTNGQSSALGKVAMAKFNNQQGLRQVGDTNWAESFASARRSSVRPVHPASADPVRCAGGIERGYRRAAGQPDHCSA